MEKKKTEIKEFEELLELKDRVKEALVHSPDVGFKIMVQFMERLGFTFIKRETEVEFYKLVDRQFDKDQIIEPMEIRGACDIERPRTWTNWVLASHKAAVNALTEYEAYKAGEARE